MLKKHNNFYAQLFKIGHCSLWNISGGLNGSTAFYTSSNIEAKGALCTKYTIMRTASSWATNLRSCSQAARIVSAFLF